MHIRRGAYSVMPSGLSVPLPLSLRLKGQIGHFVAIVIDVVSISTREERH